MLLALAIGCVSASAPAHQSPEVTQSQEFLGSLYLNYLLSDQQSEGAWKVIMKALQDAVSKQPGNESGKCILTFAAGQFARARGEAGRAREYFEEARKIDPNEILPWLGLAESDIDHGDTRKAADHLQKATQLVSQSVPDFARHLYLAKIGSLYLKAGDFSPAVSVHEAILERKPEWSLARRGLAESYLGSKQLVKALRLATQAVAAEPNEPKNHYLLATVQRAMKDASAALESFRQAVDLDPANVQYRFDLGFAFESSGRKDEALREYRKADELSQADKDRFAHLRVELMKALVRLSQ